MPKHLVALTPFMLLKSVAVLTQVYLGQAIERASHSEFIEIFTGVHIEEAT